MVALVCHPSYKGNVNRRIYMRSKLAWAKNARPYSKKYLTQKELGMWLKW
jgi:hypothetical protein